MVGIDVPHVFFPLFLIFYFIIGWYPNTKDVVDIAFMDEEVLRVFTEDPVLVYGEEEVCVGGSWWCPHCCSLELVPECISEPEYVVAHYDG